jgi:hypothetical protein
VKCSTKNVAERSCSSATDKKIARHKITAAKFALEGIAPCFVSRSKGFQYDTEATYNDRVSAVIIGPSRQIIGQYLKLCIPLVYLITLSRF